MFKNLLLPNPATVFKKRYDIAKKYKKSKNLFGKIMFFIAYYRYCKYCNLHAVRIPLDCGDGLQVPHPECVAIHHDSKIGNNLRIQKMTSVGPAFGTNKCPKIGNNVYIGPGAIIFGDIEIADNCWIGANAVVTKSFLEPYSVIAGIPAKLINKADGSWIDKMNNKNNKK